MNNRPNKLPSFDWCDQTIVPGTRIRIKSRDGSTGQGTVTCILYWANCPPTICAEMDPDTEYGPQRAGWPHDSQRIPDIGLWGGEIEEILKKN
jgi:hypothetical protein